jgi:polyphosphate kinase
MIEALYEASQAGVQIDLIVRGICCLRPQLKGISEYITVRSIVGRFLEHSRVFYFENACQPEIFVGSADWMPRNFFRRIEVVFPIEDGNLRERVITELLALPLMDNTKAHIMQVDGAYERLRRKPGEKPHHSQAEFIARTVQGPAPKTGASKSKYPRVRLAPRPKLR